NEMSKYVKMLYFYCDSLHIHAFSLLFLLLRLHDSFKTQHSRYEIMIQSVFYNLIHHRSEEHTSELQSRVDLVCRLLLEKKQKIEPGVVSARQVHASRSGMRVATGDGLRQAARGRPLPRAGEQTPRRVEESYRRHTERMG